MCINSADSELETSSKRENILMLWLHERAYRGYNLREYYHCDKIKVY